MALIGQIGAINNDKEFYQWLKSSGKLSPLNNENNTDLNYYHSMYDEEYKASGVQNKMGDLSNQLTNFQSPFYQQYASYLQKTTPQMGVNSLLAPLMAGGASYAGGQNIVAEKQKQFAGQRQDKINTGVQGFALGNLGVGAGLLGQQGNLGLGWANLNEEKRQYDDQTSGWNQLFGMLGQATGFVPGLFGGGGGASGYGGYNTGGASSQQATAGYRG